jgi:cation transport ATPase
VAADADGGELTASAVTAALRRVRGVRWAEVNAVTGHALVLFDERRVNLGTLVDTVDAVEDARSAEGGWSRAEPPHPDDPAAMTAAVLGLAADTAGLVAALASRLLYVPPVPTAARVAVGALEAQPRLRRLVETALGPAGTDALIGVGAGVLNGLTGGVGPQVVTALSHLLLVGEVRSRRQAWREHGRPLEEAADASIQHPPVKTPRPVPFPPGPIERFADRVAAASLLASGAVFAMTGDIARTAKLLLIGVPPAARLGREAFASVLAIRLAAAGAVVMDPGIFRRLDRIDTVLVDERLVHDLPGEADPADWQRALQDLQAQPFLAVGCAAGPDGASCPLTSAEIGRLQDEGRGILVVAGSDNAVLAAADVAIAVPVGGEPAGWAADLVTGPDGRVVLPLLRAVPAARRLSRRAVAVSGVGTAAAALATAFVPWAPGDLTLQPVYLSGLITQIDGIVTARRVR